jgi:hypothetical protein
MKSRVTESPDVIDPNTQARCIGLCTIECA